MIRIPIAPGPPITAARHGSLPLHPLPSCGPFLLSPPCARAALDSTPEQGLRDLATSTDPVNLLSYSSSSRHFLYSQVQDPNSLEPFHPLRRLHHGRPHRPRPPITSTASLYPLHHPHHPCDRPSATLCRTPVLTAFLYFDPAYLGLQQPIVDSFSAAAI